MKVLIFGAKSIALGVCEAVRVLYPETNILGFMVSSLEGNARALAGLPVYEVRSLAEQLSGEDKQALCVLVSVPEDIHGQIVQILQENGFVNYELIHSRREAWLMERYFKMRGQFPSVHELSCAGKLPRISIYAAKFYKDKPLKNPPCFPDYVFPMLLGADLRPGGICDEKFESTEGEGRTQFFDNAGLNISSKNPNYCEMTGFYWIWKNRLNTDDEYVGLYHYRRMLDISEDDLRRIKSNGVDVVLSFPTLHEPDIKEHHGRYIEEKDWQAMLSAFSELYPCEMQAYEEIFSDRYFYNYNLIIVKKGVFADYCKWVFPLLERTEELSTPRGWERGDRYTAYMSESLLTFYFLYHRNELKIYHAGRLLFT